MTNEYLKTLKNGDADALVASRALFGVLGIPWGPECAVHNGKRHCPEPPTVEVEINEERKFLCAQCFENVKRGAYGHANIGSVRHLPPNKELTG
jgi:hypothetical protein